MPCRRALDLVTASGIAIWTLAAVILIIRLAERTGPLTWHIYALIIALIAWGTWVMMRAFTAHGVRIARTALEYTSAPDERIKHP